MKQKRKVLVALAATFLTLFPLEGKGEDKPASPTQVPVKESGLSEEMKIGVKDKIVETPGEVRGKEISYCIHFDPAKWEVTKEITNPAAEFAFKKKGDALYAFVIPEASPVSLEVMPEIIVYNATSRGMKDVKVLKKETKKVDGKDVLFVEWEGTLNNESNPTKITYVGVIYTGSEGTIQFYTFTMSNFIDMYRKEMMEILNGLCFLKN